MDKEFDASAGPSTRHDCLTCGKSFETEEIYIDHFCEFKCDACSRTFDSRIELKKHVPDCKTCIECNKKLRSHSGLKQHMECHMEDDNFLCIYCREVFHNSITFQEHLQLHRIAKCKFCNKEYTNKRYFTRHMKIHIANNKYKCPACPKIYNSMEELDNHLRAPRSFVCTHCSQPIEGKLGFGSHMASHNDVSVKHCDRCQEFFEDEAYKTHMELRSKYHCSKCDQLFCFNDQLLRHTLYHGSIDCDICLERFTTLESLRDHLRKPSELICPVCEIQFEWFCEFDVHKYKCHPEENKFQCEFCSEIFPTYISLEEHMSKYKKCEECDKYFKNYTDLRSHKNHHKKHDKFLCTQCLKLFDTSDNLNTHIKKDHKILRCKFCQNEFTNQRVFSFHKKIHITMNEFKCIKCPKKFPTLDELQEHMRAPLRYKCDMCDKTFPAIDILLSHLLESTPFICPVCAINCEWRCELEIHMLQHTGELKCDVCHENFVEIYALENHKRSTHHNLDE